MLKNDMFSFLKDVASRPNPFEFNNPGMLWNDAYISKQLLGLHLDPSVDMVSRNEKVIDQSVAWLEKRFNISQGTTIADVGCGPGLYAVRLALLGAAVTGIDISQRSIDYGKRTARQKGLVIDYVCQDYLAYAPFGKFDLILMIFCNLSCLDPDQCQLLLKKFHNILEDGGAVVLDVYSSVYYDHREETSSCEHILDGGFWSAKEYFGFLNIFKYQEEKAIVDKYTLVEKDRIRTFYNWLQTFTKESLLALFEESGFKIEAYYNDLIGTPYTEKAYEFAVVARKA